ncbi:MAG: carbon-nitrogen hydrolase family protein, partial [Calditrichota bacterium]
MKPNRPFLSSFFLLILTVMMMTVLFPIGAMVHGESPDEADANSGISTIKVAAAQILTGYDIESNLKKIVTAIREAHDQGCKIILFHEGCLAGYPDGEHIGEIKFARVREGERRIRDLAGELGIAVLLGSCSKEESGYYDYVLVINEDGQVLGRYTKTWRAGEPHYTAGTGPVIFRIAGVEATVIICHDLRYPTLARLGVAAGAQIVFIANNESGITAEHKLLGYRSMQIARATENMVYSVMSNAPADPENLQRSNTSHGNSKIVDPMGNVLDEATVFEERLVTGTLDLSRADRSTVLRTMGKNKHTEKLYDVQYENPEISKWVLEGVKLVRRLDG